MCFQHVVNETKNDSIIFESIRFEINWKLLRTIAANYIAYIYQIKPFKCKNQN